MPSGTTKHVPPLPVPSSPTTTTGRFFVIGLHDVLLAHLADQRARNLDAAGFVFTNQAGRMLRPSTFSTRGLDRTLEPAGIGKAVTLYSLRHAFATLHVVAGTPIKVVSDALGHANMQQTANTYQHAGQGVTADWMQRFEQQLNDASSAQHALTN